MKTRLLLLLIILAVSACQGRRFEPAWSVSKFRIMGLKADPPELRANDSTTLEPLLHAPNDGPISYHWEWCPFQTTGSNFYECPVTQEELEEQIADNLPDDVPASLFEFPDFELGTDPTAELEYPLAPPLLLAFCEAIAQAAADAGEENEQFAGALPQLTCEEGYEVSVRLVARNSDQPVTDEILENLAEQDQGEVLVAGKRVTLWLGSINEQDLNPIIEEIQIRPKHTEDLELLEDAGHAWVDEIPDIDDDWYTILPDDPPEILVGVEYELRSLVDPDSVQLYAKLAPAGSDESDDDGEPDYQDPKREVLAYQWFTTAGALGSADGLYVDGRNDLGDASRTDFHIPTTDTSQSFGGADGERFIDSCPEVEDGDDETGCEVELWSVVRDDRRGQNWLNVRLLATEVTEDGFRGEPEVGF